MRLWNGSKILSKIILFFFFSSCVYTFVSPQDTRKIAFSTQLPVADWTCSHTYIWRLKGSFRCYISAGPDAHLFTEANWSRWQRSKEVERFPLLSANSFLSLAHDKWKLLRSYTTPVWLALVSRFSRFRSHSWQNAHTSHVFEQDLVAFKDVNNQTGAPTTACLKPASNLKRVRELNIEKLKQDSDVRFVTCRCQIWGQKLSF